MPLSLFVVLNCGKKKTRLAIYDKRESLRLLCQYLSLSSMINSSDVEDPLEFIGLGFMSHFLLFRF